MPQTKQIPWIKVEDRLPEQDQVVLTTSAIKKDRRYFTSSFKDGDFLDLEGDKCDYVTHWALITEPV